MLARRSHNDVIVVATVTNVNDIVVDTDIILVIASRDVGVVNNFVVDITIVNDIVVDLRSSSR